MTPANVVIQCPNPDCGRPHRMTVREVSPYRPATRNAPREAAVTDVQGPVVCACGTALDTPEIDALARAKAAWLTEDARPLSYDDRRAYYTGHDLGPHGEMAYD